MEADDGLSQAMFAGSQDERPEIGYGGGDLVQKLLAKAQFVDESSIAHSPAPTKPVTRLSLRRTRRNSKEKELALMALRMPPKINSNPQEAPSPGPVTRSRSTQSLSSSSPSNGSRAAVSRSSPCPSLDDSTETLFGAIPPTPPLSRNQLRSVTKNSKIAEDNAKSPRPFASVVEKSGQTDKRDGSLPRTPKNQSKLSFSSGIPISKASTPLSTPTAGCRIKPRSGSLLSSISPSCSQPVGSLRSEDQRRNGRTLSQTKFGWTGRQSIAMLRRETIFEDDEEENKVEKSDDSFDEDELLSQVASRVEQKFIATQKTHSEDTDAHSRPSQSVPGSNGRTPRSTQNTAKTGRSGVDTATPRGSSRRTPRRRHSKEREPPPVEAKLKSIESAKVDPKPAAITTDVKKTRGALSDSQNSASSGEIKRVYTEEEIRKKREAALRKRQQKVNAK